MLRRSIRTGLVALALAACAAPTIVPTITALPTRTPTATSAPTATSVPPTPTAIPSPTATPRPQPTPDAEARNRVIRLPILMYHYVEPWPAEAGEVRQGLTVRPEDFVAQMQYLSQRGYVSVSLYDLIAALTRGAPLPERPVVISFDDGYRGLMEYALPPMRELGFTGTVFVITEPMDENRAEYLTWDDARTLYANGWQIESHGKTHANLHGADRDRLIYELLGSLQTIEANIGMRPRFICYPFGFYDTQTVQVAQELDYWAGITTVPGRVHTYSGRFDLKRVRVEGQKGLEDFIQGLEGDLNP